MRNLTNTQGLRADKRFEALVKQEMVEHQHIISSHHKEMQELRDRLSLAMERFESLSKKNDDDLKQAKIDTACTIALLQYRVGVNESLIEDHKKTIEDLHKQLLAFQEQYSSKSDTSNIKKSVDEQIKEITSAHISEFQEYQREVKSLFNSLKYELTNSLAALEQKLAKLSDTVENNFYVFRLDKEGVLKEIRIYEKTIFIIEKKLENIYTLIERINKRERGESCHKQG
jgi:DNA repair ATPase RecN